MSIIKSNMDDLEVGRCVLRQEAQALELLAESLDESFVQVIEKILASSGRVITCGLGKSGHIARKTAGTLSSTGTPSLFLHAVEAVHGDLGMVTPLDIVIMYTHSGETEELLALFSPLKEIGATIVLITGRPSSSAARLSDLVLDTGVREEACPLNLAPTTSTTAMLALSDALAVALMERRSFGREEFGKLHPRGTLGKRLTLRVADVMRPLAEIAALPGTATGLEVIQAMTSTGVGAACIVDGDRLVGLVSESDWRRHYLEDREAFHLPAEKIMNSAPATIEPDLLAIEAIEAFQNFPIKIGEFPVVENGVVLGLLVLKDLVRSGII